MSAARRCPPGAGGAAPDRASRVGRGGGRPGRVPALGAGQPRHRLAVRRRWRVHGAVTAAGRARERSISGSGHGERLTGSDTRLVRVRCTGDGRDDSTSGLASRGTFAARTAIPSLTGPDVRLSGRLPTVGSRRQLVVDDVWRKRGAPPRSTVRSSPRRAPSVSAAIDVALSELIHRHRLRADLVAYARKTPTAEATALGAASPDWDHLADGTDGDSRWPEGQ